MAMSMMSAASAASANSAAYARHLPLAEKACQFLTASPDPFHAVKNCVAQLHEAGFTALKNKAGVSGKIQPGGKYYYTVQQSTLVAFTVGQQYSAGQGGFKIIGGHTDSPNLKVKPKSKKPSKSGTVQLGVECYGGGLWHTWFDRDLSLSGKVLVRDGSTVQHRLINLKDPVARVSTLCIHLQTAEERKAFAVNKEDHTSPVIAMKSTPNGGGEQLEQSVSEQINDKGDGGGNGDEDSWRKGQEPLLLQRIATELDCTVDQIADFELNLYDTQPAALGGMNKEFLYSARLDNLATVFCAVEALVHHSADLSTDQDISLVVAFDHEEVGSQSMTGAGSPVMAEAVRRISAALNSGSDTPDLYASTVGKSFCLSIDQAHAVHPCYSGKHESQHSPLLNHGIVMKTNSNQRYTTNSTTGFIVRELGRKTGVPIQEFVVRNDCPCGSTIGPILSSRTGIRTVDAGMPQLSMHSCREMMGIADLTHGVELFKGFFSLFRSIDDSIEDMY